MTTARGRYSHSAAALPAQPLEDWAGSIRRDLYPSGYVTGSAEARAPEHATRAELQSIADQTTHRTAYLRLAETLTAFLTRLGSSAATLD